MARSRSCADPPVWLLLLPLGGYACPKDIVRIAALGDLHYGRTATPGSLQPLFSQINESADILALCGDLTDYGLAEEARALVKEICRPSRFRSSPSSATTTSNPASRTRSADPRDAGVVDRSTATPPRSIGVGFAGIKGFAGGFGRRALGPWGEDIIKKFVHEAVDEALKLESALARLRNDALIAVLHYAPIQATVEGEPLEIYPVPRLQPARGADHPLSRSRAVFHGHAHHGAARRPHRATTFPSTTSRCR